MVGEEQEGLDQAEAGDQAVLQGEMLLPHRRPAGRVLRRESQKGSALQLQRALKQARVLHRPPL